jgi:hypothetical protein
VVGVGLTLVVVGPGVPVVGPHAATATAVAPNPAACKNARRLIAILTTSSPEDASEPSALPAVFQRSEAAAC